ncbi:hypothetical protein APR50_39420 [Variovorax paradoxus]|nr:hypothetical protein APR52_42575 [Variovorax paradoxus]KPU92785.1 hypothetical protein APR50_39420 [Variovorax paradoxus]KPU93938.1 hypothetical protein APR49_38780 [Variovorax paradoxus]KPV14588.1 hypothetical protein APR51_38380 [Variovorax paradoxus]KPV21171.1 hypothetical protein APR48_38190 [Variovorax paradoxus]
MARLVFFAALEADASLAATGFFAGDFFTGGLTACLASELTAVLPARAFGVAFFRAAFTGLFAAAAGAAAAGLDGAFTAVDPFCDLPFLDPARDLTCFEATDLDDTFSADAELTGAAAAGATAPAAKLSSVRPAAIASRSHAGLGPRPLHWLPRPSLNFAPGAAAPRWPFVALDADREPAAEVELNFRSPAVRPYIEIMSLIFAMAPLASMARCFWAEACSAAISRANWA